jgi:hypothetical protein
LPWHGSVCVRFVSKALGVERAVTWAEIRPPEGVCFYAGIHSGLR